MLRHLEKKKGLFAFFLNHAFFIIMQDCYQKVGNDKNNIKGGWISKTSKTPFLLCQGSRTTIYVFGSQCPKIPHFLLVIQTSLSYVTNLQPGISETEIRNPKINVTTIGRIIIQLNLFRYTLTIVTLTMHNGFCFWNNNHYLTRWGC